MQRCDGGGGPGSLTVVGLGPGDASLLAPMALAALTRARVLVGYGTYMDLLDPVLREGRDVVVTGMKQEMRRVAEAVDRARAGEDVALISSGDAGVYGMAGLALEILEQTAGDGLPDPDFTVVPGIPALAAGAALLGAPLTHDFAVVSLSDLLTPWEAIEKRLDHAAAADFVIVLYNPRSKRRDWQLPRALEIIAAHRAPETPVGLVRSAYRQGQEVSAAALADFDPGEADMLSIVFVGNSATRLSGGRMVTPRGYLERYGTS
ncbi:precorrin-3B C(17)-methyltransferase [Desulfocurvus sp. DL9XJH121]